MNKWVSIGLGVLAAGLVLVGVLAPGCSWLHEERSPLSGNSATPETMRAELEALARKTAADEVEAGKTADRSIASARTWAAGELAKIDGDQAKAVAVVNEKLAEKIGTAETAYAGVVNAGTSGLEQATAQVDAAVARIHRRREVVGAVLNAAKSIPGVAAVPYADQGLGLLGLVLGVGYGLKKRGDENAAKARESDAKKEAVTLGDAITSMVKGLDIARAADPQLAEAMKKNAKFLTNTYTDAAHEYVRLNSVT